MSSAIYYRLIGQVVILTLHWSNSIVMHISMQDKELMRDPEIKTMTSLQNQYLTVWNIGFQIFYFSLALLCDFATVMKKDHFLPKSIKRFRHHFFASIIWPVALVIFIIFWPLFLTNRELLFPAFIDKIFSIRSNLVMHFFILPAVIWELLFLTRHIPKTHARYLSVTTGLYISYASSMIYTYHQRGLWPYPIFSIIYGTVYFPVFLAIVYLVTVACYYSQWKVTSMVRGKSDIKKYK